MANTWDDYISKKEGGEQNSPQEQEQEQESSVSLGGDEKTTGADVDKDVALVSSLVNGSSFLQEYLRTLLEISTEQSEENFSNLNFAKAMTAPVEPATGIDVAPIVNGVNAITSDIKKKVLVERRKDFFRYVDYLNKLKSILDKKKE